ncbi:MAG: WD40 repeat domain-containing protein [Cypionkella sp.]
MKDERAHLQLFDLIARDWLVASPVQQICFNADDSAVAFASADGSVHLAATADKASPNLRTRRAVDTGRLTIAAREKPFLPLKPADFSAGRSSDVVPFGATGFAFAKDTGRINSLTPGGIAVHMAARAPAAITGLASAPDGKTIAFASRAQVHISAPNTDMAQVFDLAGPISALAFSSDGLTLAVAYPGGVSRWTLQALDTPPTWTELSGTPTQLVWHPEGTWLTACMEEDGFALVNLSQNSVQHRGNFPSPVRNAVFGRSTDTVVASGAFRVAAWSLEDGRDVITGKAGLVLVNAVATCPTRNLVAVGYANGLLSLAEIGRPSEILLREDTGAGIAAMAWSNNGTYLALAGTDGSAALVEFPDSMFKS